MKADFYSFLYSFHKQLSEEEQARMQLINEGPAMGGAPGQGKGRWREQALEHDVWNQT